MARLQESIRGLAPGSLVADRFRVEQQLGAGAARASYAVFDQRACEPRALALYELGGSDGVAVERFVSEALAAGRLGVDSLVRVLEGGTLPSGGAFLVMAPIAGTNLQALLLGEDELPVERACELVAQAAEGLDACHRAGLLHLALSPASLFVREHAHDVQVTVLDFGLHRLGVGSGADHTAALRAPECLRQEASAIDARADVFALGAILFECLAGESPFAGCSERTIATRILHGKSGALSDLRPDLRPELVLTVNRAIANDASVRTGTMRELISALAPFRMRG